MLSAIIFDLDGVLADSEPWWSEIDAKLLAEHGVTYRGEYHQNVVGVSYRLVVEFYKKAFGLSVPTEEMMQRRGEIATEFFADRVDLFPNVKEVLEKLRQMKLHLAVATSSVSASARPFLDRHQLTGFFEVIVTGEEVERRQTRARHLPVCGGATLESLLMHALWLRMRFLASLRPKRRTCASPRSPTNALSIRASTRKRRTTFSAA